jgi:uncharacterized membrane protein YphA (DoxX/SURF4 family)
MKTTSSQNILFGSSLGTSDKLVQLIYLLFRLHVGLSIAIGAGLSKIFHKINEKGTDDWDNLAFGVPEWFTKQVADIGFTFISPSFWAHLAVYGEFIGGLLIALGLLTRLSALQLAFQFFVISFVWYDDPGFITGMYYQQLFFWAFMVIAALGSGKYSLDTLVQQRRAKLPKMAVALVVVLLVQLNVAQAQTSSSPRSVERVSFSIKNPTFKGRTIDFRYWNADNKKRAGYGYGLNARENHPTNMPVGTRIYLEEKGKKTLLYVLTAQDNGRQLNINEKYELTREQYLDAAHQEQNEETEAVAKAKDPADESSVEKMAKAKGLKMVSFRVKCASVWPRQIHVRVQLPWDTKKSMHGFSTTMTPASSLKMNYPVGSKVYLCDGAYWKSDANVTEKLIATIDEEKTNYTFKL